MLQQKMRVLANQPDFDLLAARGALIEGAAVIDIREQETEQIRQERNELRACIQRLREELSNKMNAECPRGW